MKRALSLLLIITTIFTLAACQVTPEKPIVVQKDTERMVKQAQDDTKGTKVSKLKVPEGNYTYTTTAAEGKLTIKVDAPVTIPKSEKIPTARVAEAGFTQAQVTAFFNYLFPDEKPVTGANEPRVMTKDEIKQLILKYKKYIAEGTADEKTMYTKDELQEEIKNLEKQYASAPEKAPKLNTKVSDGTMTAEKAGGDKYAGEKLLKLEAQTEDRSITVHVPVDENGNWENYFIFAREEPNRNSGQFSEMNAVKIDEANWKSAAKGKLNITYDKAKALCEGFFAAGNITDVALDNAFIMDDERTDHGDGRSNPPQNYICQLNYVRTVGDCPAACMSYLGGGDEHAIPWMYERIMFWVNDSGLLYIDWASHTETGETVNKDTGVIDFEQARQIFETMIVKTYGASKEWPKVLADVGIDIDRIELSLVRVREQNAPGRNGIYTPAWVFYGNIKKEYEKQARVQYGWDTGNEYPFTKYPVLIVNAVDGSIIDTSKGY
jgi:hypothetical protein